MKKRLLIVIGIFIVLICGWHINDIVNNVEQKQEYFVLDEKYYVGTQKEYSKYIIELSHSMYYEKLNTGFCVFMVKDKYDSIDTETDFPGGVSIKGDGSLSSVTKVEDGKLFFYVSFSMVNFSDDYEETILIEFSNGDIVTFELDNTVEEEYILNDEYEVIISPVCIWIKEDDIDYLKIVYDDSEEIIIKDRDICKDNLELQSVNNGVQISFLKYESIRCRDITEIVINSKKIKIDKTEN